MFVGQHVSTPYGEGEIVSINDNNIVVVPFNWAMAMGQKPTFYMNPNDTKPLFGVGTSIKCVFGNGTVTAVRDSDNIFVVTLNNWKLADGKSPVLFMNQSSISLVKGSNKSDSDIEAAAAAAAAAQSKAQFEEYMRKATEAKNEATEAFKKNDIETARLKYMTVLETLQVRGPSHSMGIEMLQYLILRIFCHLI